MHLVPILTAEQIELTRLTLHNAWQEEVNDRLRDELAPLQNAFEQFEREYGGRIGPLTAELQRLQQETTRLRGQAERVHARIVSDPDHVLGDIFSRDELLEIGRLFNIDVPPEWFTGSSRRTSRGGNNWDWADAFDPGSEWIDLHLHRRTDRTSRQALQLREHYHTLARRFHPDLATDESERAWRQDVMLRINDAWQRQDLPLLVSIADELERDLPGWSASAIEHRLAWARREHGRLRTEGLRLTRRIQQLRQSKTLPLWYNAPLRASAIANRTRTLQVDIERARIARSRAIDALREALSHLLR